MELQALKKLKLFIGLVALLAALTCEAQFKKHGFRLLFPNAGLYSGNHPELIDWMKANGVPTSNFKFGGDLFCVTYQARSNVIVGLAAGGIYTSTNNSNLRVGYGDLIAGTPLFTKDRFQVSLLGHVTFFGYTIPGVIPPGAAVPPSNRYFMRAYDFGGGASLRTQYLLLDASFMSMGLGVEGGLTVLDPNASWQFGYTVPTTNGRSHFVGTPVQGPQVDSIIPYLRFSLVFTGGDINHPYTVTNIFD
jgi:hypothetical protein